MKLNRVYIISWLGGEKSKATVMDNIRRWQTLGFQVTVIAQEWPENLHPPKGVELVQFPMRTSPAAARNSALSLHYQSEDDFAFISDDDVILRNHKELVENIRAMSASELADVDLLLPSNEDKDLIPSKQSFVLKMGNDGKGGLFLIKNLPKHGLPPMQFDLYFRWMGDELIYGEDHEFVYSFFRMSLGAWRCADLTVDLVGGSSWVREDGQLPYSLGHSIYERKYKTRIHVPPKLHKLRKVL